MLGKIASVALGLLASLAFLPMVANIPGIWRVYDFFRGQYTAIAFSLLMLWIAVTVWVVMRADRKPYWLFAFGVPAMGCASIYLLFWAACAFFSGCI